MSGKHKSVNNQKSSVKAHKSINSSDTNHMHGTCTNKEECTNIDDVEPIPRIHEIDGRVFENTLTCQRW